MLGCIIQRAAVSSWMTLHQFHHTPHTFTDQTMKDTATATDAALLDRYIADAMRSAMN